VRESLRIDAFDFVASFSVREATAEALARSSLLDFVKDRAKPKSCSSRSTTAVSRLVFFL